MGHIGDQIRFHPLILHTGLNCYFDTVADTVHCISQFLIAAMQFTYIGSVGKIAIGNLADAFHDLCTS